MVQVTYCNKEQEISEELSFDDYSYYYLFAACQEEHQLQTLWHPHQ